MTGFGRGVAEQGAPGRTLTATVDLRSVNHRFLDLKLRATLGPALEDQLGAKIRATIERGSIAVTVHVVAHTTRASALRVDEAAAHHAHATLRQLATSLGLAPPDLALVLAQPGVVLARGNEPDAEAPDAAVLAALELALAGLQDMRATEGRALERELVARIDELTSLRASIEGHAAGVTEHLHKKLLERLARLVGETGVDPTRLAQEVALLAERADLTEELVRLASHLEQARAIIAAPAVAGRKLDFLVQEIGRELNTIGAKAQRTEISSSIVEAKSVLEKLREQVQNVE